ncbi:hypothetical protein N7490_006697 [Penicillium lividum]|nr:hypothetical protein N7490_006697 [Penicillium lividum]
MRVRWVFHCDPIRLAICKIPELAVEGQCIPVGDKITRKVPSPQMWLAEGSCCPIYPVWVHVRSNFRRWDTGLCFEGARVWASRSQHLRPSRNKKHWGVRGGVGDGVGDGAGIHEPQPCTIESAKARERPTRWTMWELIRTNPPGSSMVQSKKAPDHGRMNKTLRAIGSRIQKGESGSLPRPSLT